MFSILRPYIFSLDPEVAHDLAIKSLKANFLPKSIFAVENEEMLETNLFGKSISNPIGLAAGFDKNAEVYNSLFKLGFGFVEVGTVTPLKQYGNPKPRVFRLVEDEALINRLGFNNYGAMNVLERIKSNRQNGLLGINIGPNKDTENRLNEGKGFLLEVNRPSRIGPSDVYFNSLDDCCNYYTIKDPKVEFGDSNFTSIKSYINEVETTVFGENFSDSVTGYSKYLDVESFIDWFIVHEITKENESSWGSSCYLNYGKDVKLKMLPVWDLCISLGNDNTEELSIEGYAIIKNKKWYGRLFQDSIFVEKLKNRYRHYYSNRDEFLDEIDANAFYLYEAQKRNFTKWPILGVYVYPNATNFSKFSHEVSYLKDWLKNRMDWLNEEIENL